MIALVKGELLKIRTTRSFWWTILLGLALMALITFLQAGDHVETESDVRAVLSNTGIIGLLMIVLGVVGSAGEYRHGTITSSLLSVPSRSRFLAAKAIAYGIMGIAVALVSAVIVVGLAALRLSGDGTSISSLGISTGELVGILAGATAYIAICGVFGVGIGALLTNQVAAVVGILILLFIIDPTIGALVHSYGKFGLSGIGMALSGGTGDDAGFDLFAPGVAALVFLGYSMALIGAAVAVSTKRDVSS